MRANPKMSHRLVLSMALWAAVGATYAQSTPSPYTTFYKYDADARLVATIRPSPTGASGPFLATRSIYNSQGLVDHQDQGYLTAWPLDSVQPAAWAGFTTVQSVYYTYDISGRKLTETESSGGTAYTLTQYNYDSQGRVLCATQRMNPAAFASLPDACTLGTQGSQGPDRITYTTYDPMGRPLQIQKAYGTPLAYTYATYTYNVGPQQSVHDSTGAIVLTFNSSGPLQSVTDADGNYTYYAYDNLVRLQNLYFPSPISKGSYNSADYEQYSYDLNGYRKTLRKRDGNTISYDYDGLNRLVDEIYPSGTIQNAYYGYDLRGLKLYARFASSAGPGLTQTYDGFGHVLTAASNQSGPALTLSYKYDAEGNRTRITHPDSSYFQYAYDGLNRLSTINENGATTVITQNYDSAGRRWTVQRGATVSTTTALYDGVSRLQTLTQDLQGSSYDDTRTFAYNSANQVVSRTLSNATYSFTQVPTTGLAYSVNGLNQYTQLILTGFTGPSIPAVPTYDPNGNMTSDGASIFKYDVLNRMISSAGAKTVSMAYDPNGRLSQTSGGASGVTQFLYDGDVLVAEYSGSGNLLRRYVHGARVDEPLLSYEGPTVGAANRRYFHADHQGSVIAMTDTNGNAIQSNTYDPYGGPATGNTGRFQYTGQVSLSDLGMYYYKARIYNASLGRFMQTDPVGYSADNDLYTYADNDPLNKSDATGLDPDCSTTCQILGKAQKTGSKGHDVGSANVAKQMAASGEYTSVHLNQELGTITGDKTMGQQRPDVAGVRKDGKIDITEVVSPSQTKGGQEAKVAGMLSKLGDKAGEGKTLSIGEALGPVASRALGILNIASPIVRALDLQQMEKQIGVKAPGFTGEMYMFGEFSHEDMKQGLQMIRAQGLNGFGA